MVDICLKLLDMSHKHKQDPAEDVSSRCDPVYVGRVVSAMVGRKIPADWSRLDSGDALSWDSFWGLKGRKYVSLLICLQDQQ